MYATVGEDPPQNDGTWSSSLDITLPNQPVHCRSAAGSQYVFRFAGSVGLIVAGFMPSTCPSSYRTFIVPACRARLAPQPPQNPGGFRILHVRRHVYQVGLRVDHAGQRQVILDHQQLGRVLHERRRTVVDSIADFHAAPSHVPLSGWFEIGEYHHVAVGQVARGYRPEQLVGVAMPPRVPPAAA